MCPLFEKVANICSSSLCITSMHYEDITDLVVKTWPTGELNHFFDYRTIVQIKGIIVCIVFLNEYIVIHSTTFQNWIKKIR